MKTNSRQLKFWSHGHGSFVYCKLHDELVLFEPEELYAKAREVILKFLGGFREQDIVTFRHVIETGHHAFQPGRYYSIEDAVFARLLSGDLQLRKEHCIEGPAAMEALEDVFTIVAFNRHHRFKKEGEIFVDSRPLKGDPANSWVQVRIVKRRNWLQRRMEVVPKTLDEFSFLRNDVLSVTFSPYTWAVKTRHGRALCGELGPRWDPNGDS